ENIDDLILGHRRTFGSLTLLPSLFTLKLARSDSRESGLSRKVNVSPTETASNTKREIQIEIPADEVTRETDTLIQKYQKVARLPKAILPRYLSTASPKPVRASRYTWTTFSWRSAAKARWRSSPKTCVAHLPATNAHSTSIIPMTTPINGLPDKLLPTPLRFSPSSRKACRS